MTDKQLPTLRPGDSHMESLIESAIQGHADTRAAMRWLVRQLVPAAQPAEVTDEQIIDIAAEWSSRDFANGAWRFCTDFARAILALRPVQVPMKDEQHPLMVFAIEAEMGAYQENEIPLAARKAIKAAKTYGITVNPSPCIPDWAACQRIAEVPEVDEVLRLFAEGETTEDQAVAIVQAVLTAAQAKKETP